LPHRAHARTQPADPPDVGGVWLPGDAAAPRAHRRPEAGRAEDRRLAQPHRDGAARTAAAAHRLVADAATRAACRSRRWRRPTHRSVGTLRYIAALVAANGRSYIRTRWRSPVGARHAGDVLALSPHQNRALRGARLPRRAHGHGVVRASGHGVARRDTASFARRDGAAIAIARMAG